MCSFWLNSVLNRSHRSHESRPAGNCFRQFTQPLSHHNKRKKRDGKLRLRSLLLGPLGSSDGFFIIKYSIERLSPGCKSSRDELERRHICYAYLWQFNIEIRCTHCAPILSLMLYRNCKGSKWNVFEQCSCFSTKCDNSETLFYNKCNMGNCVKSLLCKMNGSKMTPN